MKFFIYCFYFLALLPALSIYPISTDVQPLVFVLSFFIFSVYLFNYKFYLNKFEIYFLILSVISVFYINYNYNLTDRVGLFSGFLVYIVSKRHLKFLDTKVILFTSIINTFGIVWHFINSSSFVAFSSYFVRKIKITEIGFRGASGFSPEPGFASAICITIIIICIHFYNNNKISKFQLFFLLSSNFVSILLTKSATGLFYLILIVGILIFSLVDKKKILLIILLFFFIFINIDFEQLYNSRSFDLIKKILENPQLILSDASISERLIGLDIGLRSLFLNPIGFGAGSFSDVSNFIVGKYNLDTIYLNTRDSGITSTSAIGTYFVEFGIFILIWFYFILFYKFKFNTLNIIIVLISALFLMFSFSIAFPPTYILLSILHSKFEFKS